MGILGDSKSISGYSWGASLITALNVSFRGAVNVTENLTTDGSRDWAVMGYTVAMIKDNIDAWLLNHSVVVSEWDIFLIDLGANDVGSLPLEAAWEANYLYIIDAIVAKYPQAQIYLTYPWRRGKASECNTLAGWINTIIASRPSNVFAGDDERVWLEGGDDGATMTTDGIHYSTAGQVAKIAAVRAALGL